MELETILYDRKDGIAFIRFNRPRVLNAVNGTLLSEFMAVLRLVEADTEVRAVIIKGEGRAFCAGDDLKEPPPPNLEEGLKFVEMLQDTTRVIMRMPKPVIAAIHGYALGAGCEWAMNCDVRIAAEGAKLGFPETGIGMTVTNAGTKLLPLLVGTGRAKELVFTCDKIDATQAEQWGLVNKVVPMEELESAAVEMAHRMMRNFPVAIAFSKRALNHGPHLGLEETLEMESRDVMAAVLILTSMQTGKGGEK